MLWICATCPRSDRRSRSNRETATRDLYVHEVFALAGPRFTDRRRPRIFRCLRVNLPAPSPRSNDPGTSRARTTTLIVDSLHLWGDLYSTTFLLWDFNSVDLSSEPKGAIPPEHSRNLNSFEKFSNLLPARSSLSLPETLKSSGFCGLTLATASTLLCPDLLLRLHVQPAPTCTVRTTQHRPWATENKKSTAQPPRHTLCGGIQLHSMQESPGSSRETIKTHGFRFLTSYAIT